MTNGTWAVAAGAVLVVACACDSSTTTVRPDASAMRDAATPERDAATFDAPPRPDAPPLTCDVGEPCSADRGCRLSASCIEEGFPGGYCTQLGTIGGGGCDPDTEGSCGDCGTCIVAGVDASGADVTLCASNCAPSVTDSTCRNGYECTLGSGVCLPGCASDAECGDAAVDPPGTWTCNADTHRCEHVPPEGAEAGIACTRDAECELRGRCLDETDAGWPGGYCIKLGCDVAGNDCAGDGYCDERAFGLAVCLAPCEVGAAMTPGDPFSPSRDCRAGYTCYWDGASGPGVPNGGCIPGAYNDVRTANVGATCNAAGDASECWSPHGLGQCRDWDGASGAGGGYCTLFECAAPGVDDATVCGEGAICASASGSVTTLCLQTCTTADECTAGYGCWNTSMAGIVTGGATVCFAGCLEDAHCRSGESCNGGSATTVGSCEPG